MKSTGTFLLLALFLPCTCHVWSQDQNVRFETDTALILQDSIIQKVKLYKPKQMEASEEFILEAIKREAPFGIYKDNFFVTGIPLNKKPSRSTSDALFQISIRHRITRNVLPFNTFLYLTYTQKSFWNIYGESSPFRDNNYNPGLGLGKHLILNNKFKGAAFVQFEHESNGQGDSILSRSWNYLSFTGKYFYNPLVAVQLKLWIPYVDGGANKDLIDHRGIGVISIEQLTNNGLWWFSGDINPRKGFGNVNIRLNVAYLLSRRLNQYLFLQYYNGYGEDLLDYNRFTSQLRIGICMKPSFYSAY